MARSRARRNSSNASAGWFLILDAEGRVIGAAPYTNVYARRSGSCLVLTSFRGS